MEKVLGGTERLGTGEANRSLGTLSSGSQHHWLILPATEDEDLGRTRCHRREDRVDVTGWADESLERLPS